MPTSAVNTASGSLEPRPIVRILAVRLQSLMPCAQRHDSQLLSTHGVNWIGVSGQKHGSCREKRRRVRRGCAYERGPSLVLPTYRCCLVLLSRNSSLTIISHLCDVQSTSPCRYLLSYCVCFLLFRAVSLIPLLLSTARTGESNRCSRLSNPHWIPKHSTLEDLHARPLVHTLNTMV